MFKLSFSEVFRVPRPEYQNVMHIFKVAKVTEIREKRGVLLQFPSRENSTPQVPRERCPECARLESRIDAAISEIRAVVQGRFPSVGGKLARLFEKQDLRNKAIDAFYSHKRSAHPRKTA